MQKRRWLIPPFECKVKDLLAILAEMGKEAVQ